MAEGWEGMGLWRWMQEIKSLLTGTVIAVEVVFVAAIIESGQHMFNVKHSAIIHH